MPWSPIAAPGAADCPGELWHAPVNSRHFTQVTNVSIGDAWAAFGAPHLLSLHGSTGYVLAPTRTSGDPTSLTAATVWVTTDGTTWMSRAVRCPAGDTLDAIAPIAAAQAFGLCSGNGAAGSMSKALVVTYDAGRSFSSFGQPPPVLGDAGTIVAASSSTLVVAARAGGSELYRSADSGGTWTTPLQLADGGVGFGDIGFTTATQGFAVHAPAALLDAHPGDVNDTGPHPATVYFTFDGGAIWRPVPIAASS